MRNILRLGGIGLALALILSAGTADAGNRGPHPVIGWNGNEFLFEVKHQGGTTYLSGYRAVGPQWQYIGTTKLRKGQRVAESGFLQRIWFKGKRLGAVEADLSNPFWRRYPAEDRNGGRGGGADWTP
jgi:hypothetical protein